MFQATFYTIKNRYQIGKHFLSTYITTIHRAADTEWLTAKPFSYLPGPSKYQLLKAFLPGSKFYQKSYIDFNHQLRNEYGDIFIVPGLFGKRDIVFSYNPKDFQKVFHTEGIYPMRRGFDIIQYHRTTFKQDFFKHAIGLVAAQGKTWSNFRTAVNPIMMNPKAIKVYIPKIDHVAIKFVKCIRRIRDHRTLEVPANFEEYIKYCTMDSVGLVALDTDLNMIENSDANPKAKAIINNMEEFFQLLLELDLQPSMWKVVATPKFQKVIKVLDLLSEMALDYVNQAMSRLHKDFQNKADSDKSILERLISTDPLIATAMAMDILLAGVDTTSSALAACLICLAKNPTKQSKLREELFTYFPAKNFQLTAENMKNLPYLRACIKESLRLYPVSTGNFRTTGQDVVLSGYRIPANTDISMTAQLLSRDPKYFEDAEKFLPERWLRSNNLAGVGATISATKGNPFVYLPFGFGARVCVGKRIVDLELETVLSRLLRNFEIQFNYPTDNMFKTHVINVPAKPLKFKFIDLD